MVKYTTQQRVARHYVSSLRKAIKERKLPYVVKVALKSPRKMQSLPSSHEQSDPIITSSARINKRLRTPQALKKVVGAMAVQYALRAFPPSSSEPLYLYFNARGDWLRIIYTLTGETQIETVCSDIVCVD